VRLLVAALLLQLVVGGAFIALAVNDFPGIGSGDDDKPPTRSRDARAGAPVVPRANVDRFDEARAFALIREQVDRYGPRPAGSQASRALAEHLRPLLPNGRFEPVPGGLRNVVGRLPGRLPAIVVGAHYDTAVVDPNYVGANDGAAGVAAVVEIARWFRTHRRRSGAPAMRFVLFDGEELPPGSSDDRFLADALRGSRAYARAHRGRTREMILLDYIANRGLRLPHEDSSTPSMWQRVRTAAGRVGVKAVFPNTGQGTIYDDHTPFLRQGVPSVDLIDFSYPYAHKLSDTPDKLSPRALDAVGETIVDYLRSAQRPLH
jgi:glutaminyl-peptide cyclotransferase